MQRIERMKGQLQGQRQLPLLASRRRVSPATPTRKAVGVAVALSSGCFRVIRVPAVDVDLPLPFPWRPCVSVASVFEQLPSTTSSQPGNDEGLPVTEPFMPFVPFMSFQFRLLERQ
jgi:hypothetical protein